ncbi:MAG: metal transporter [Sphingomonas sp.]|nr:MAG: metal transporter [Sphingomonas sp.]
MALPFYGIFALLPFASPSHAQDINLPVALSRVAAADPALAANAAQLRAADAAVLQADIRPRDTVGVDIEDFAGTGSYSPVERGQTTAWYERTWERGDKRAARVDAARSDIDVVARRNQIRLLDRFANVQTALVEAQAAEAAIPVAQQHLASVQSVQAEVNRRVERALDPLFAAQRAQASVAQAKIALDRARENARATRAALAAWWGGTADFELDMASFPRLDPATEAAGTSPEAQLYTAARDAAGARVRLAESGNVADPVGRVGVRHFAEGSDVALVVGGSIPLGTGRFNRGNVERARAELAIATAEIAVVEAEQKREVALLEAERRLLSVEAARVEKEVLPAAERAVALARAGFARGGTAFTFLEISQAQQAVVDARARQVDLQRRFHLAGARIDRLTGRHLPVLTSAETR